MPQPAHPAIPTVADDLAPEDFYFDGPYLVFTAAYHLRRGFCCNSGCRHCPYSIDDEPLATSRSESMGAPKEE